jgi:hypothetical protein
MIMGLVLEGKMVGIEATEVTNKDTGKKTPIMKYQIQYFVDTDGGRRSLQVDVDSWEMKHGFVLDKEIRLPVYTSAFAGKNGVRVNFHLENGVVGNPGRKDQEEKKGQKI